jgi:hypothetical protein
MKSHGQVTSGTAIILAISFMTLLAVGAIAVVILRAPSSADQLTLIGAIVAFLSPLITALVALLRAEHANGTAIAAKEIVETHVTETPATQTPTPGV